MIYYICGMKYLITSLLLSIGLLSNSQVEVTISTMYRVPDSLSKSIHILLPSDHPHKSFGWSTDDIYLNVFPYRESIINVHDDYVNRIVYTLDTVNYKVVTSHMDYHGNRFQVRSEDISFYSIDDTGFYVSMVSGGDYSYWKVEEDICEFYKKEGYTNECHSQFVYKNEYGELEFIVKEMYGNLLFVRN